MVLRLARSKQQPMCSSDYEKTLLLWDFQYIVSVKTFVRTDNHVAYVYLGVNVIKIKRIWNLTVMNTVTAMLKCFNLEKNVFMPDSFKSAETAIQGSSVSCIFFVEIGTKLYLPL